MADQAMSKLDCTVLHGTLNSPFHAFENENDIMLSKIKCAVEFSSKP